MSSASSVEAADDRTAARTTKIVVSTSTLAGWLSVGTDGTKNMNAVSVRADKVRGTQLLWNVRRKPGSFDLLGTGLYPLTNMETLEFDIVSRDATLATVLLEETGGATFHADIPLAAQTWKHVRLKPSDFALRDDSPVKKGLMDAGSLVPKIVFADLGTLVGAKAPGQLSLTNIFLQKNAASTTRTATNSTSRSSTASLPEADLPALLEGTHEITKPCRISHPLLIRPGGKLVIKSTEVKLTGNIVVQGGSLIFENSSVHLAGRFQHDLTLVASENALVRFENCHCRSDFMNSLQVSTSTIEIRNTDFVGGGFTTGPGGGTTILDRAKAPGEFILSAGDKMIVKDSELVLFWFNMFAGPAFKGSFPEQAVVDNWRAPTDSKVDLTVDNTKLAFFGILDDTASDVSITDSNMFAVGLMFGARSKSPAEVSLRGIKNNTPVDQLHLNLADRKLNFHNTTVRTWNLYPWASTKLKVSDSVFGEIITFQNSNAEIHSSVCDGSGGYVAAQDHSTLKLANCTLKCPVVAKGDAQLVLEGCTVTGPLSASERSHVKLINTRLSQPTSKLDSATIEGL